MLGGADELTPEAIGAVAAEDGKGLSTNDFTDELKSNLETINSTYSTTKTTATTAKTTAEAAKTLAESKGNAEQIASFKLTSSGWTGTAAPYTQTVTVSGIVADESSQIIWPAPAMASQSDYIQNQVMCKSQGANSLTFSAQTKPSVDINCYVSFVDLLTESEEDATCEEGCEVSCETGCEISCDTAVEECGDACVEECQDACETSCMTSCETNCQASDSTTPIDPCCEEGCDAEVDWSEDSGESEEELSTSSFDIGLKYLG